MWKILVERVRLQMTIWRMRIACWITKLQTRTYNILQKNPTKCNSVSKFYYSLFLNEAQHVLDNTPPIIRSLKLHKQTLVLHTWKVVGRAVVGRCQVAYATWQRPTTARPTIFHVCKARGCFCSFKLLMMGGVSPEACWTSFKIRNNKILIHCCILLVF